MRHFLGITLFLVIAIIVPIVTSARTEVYIYPLTTNTTSYEVGDRVTGNFTIHNVLPTRQSDVTYSLAVISDDDPIGKLLNEEKQNDTLYLEANSKLKVPYAYTLPKYVTGGVNIVVTAHLTDGSVIGQSKAPILIKGVTTAKQLDADSVYIDVNGDKFLPQEGPTVSENDEVSFNVKFPESTDPTKIIATTYLFNRVNDSEILQTLDPVSINVGTENPNELKIDLPSDIKPLVYAGKVEFQSDEFFIEPLYFRYITAGSIATIRNINSEQLSVKKNEEFDVSILIAGTPFAFNRPEIQDEVDVEIVTMNLMVFNEKEEIVSQKNIIINPNEESSISTKLLAQNSAESMRFDAYLYNSNGNELSFFSTAFPSEAELQNQYPQEFWATYKTVILGFVFLMFALIVFLLWKKRKLNDIEGSSIVALILIIGSLSLTNIISAQNETNGYQIVSGSNILPGTNNGIELTAVLSPLPASVRTYQPGDVFDLVATAHFGACLNTSDRMYLYAPTIYPSLARLTNPDGWTNQELNNQKSWFNLTPPSNLLNLIISVDNFYNNDNPPTTLFKWVSDNLTSEWSTALSSGSQNGISLLSISLTSEFLDYQELTVPLSNTRVFDGEYFRDSVNFQNDIKRFFFIGQLSDGGTSCALRVEELEGSCGNKGKIMDELFQTRNEGIAFIRHNLLASKYRGYELGENRVPFEAEKTTESNRATLFSDPNWVRSAYKDSILMLEAASDFMEKYQLPGYQNARNFDFGGTLTYNRYGTVSIQYNEDRIDEIASSEYNSLEFNQALESILDFIFYYNQRFFVYTQAISGVDVRDVHSFVETGTVLTQINRYDLAETPQNSSYMVPPIEGYKKFYFYLYLRNNNPGEGNITDKELLVSQTIKIGDGPTCPNIDDGSVYTIDAEGNILKDGVIPNPALEKDENGSCVEVEPEIENNCNQSGGDPENYGQACTTCSLSGVIGCNGNCVNETGEDLNNYCPAPLAVSCSHADFDGNIGINEEIEFSALGQSGVAPLQYSWTTNDGQSGIGPRFNYSSETVGLKQITIIATDSATYPTTVSNTCSINVAPATANLAPEAPTITGPTTGIPATTYTFGFNSIDSDGDTLRYGIDWDNNDTVDEWTPSSNFTASGTTLSEPNNWAGTGNKTFKALAQDSRGLSSGWTTHGIFLSTEGSDVCSNISGVQTEVPEGRVQVNGECFTDVCSNLGGVQQSVPMNYERNADGTCSQSSATPPLNPDPGTPTSGCPAPNNTSHCVQLWNKEGEARYREAGISEEQYTMYYESDVQNIFFGDTPLDPQSIYAIASRSDGACYTTVCEPGTLEKNGCVNGAAARCYVEDINELTADLQVAIKTSPTYISEGEQCLITWAAQDASICNLRPSEASGSESTISRATAGQAAVVMGDTSISFTLTCQSIIQGMPQKTAQATCRSRGKFSEI